VDALVDTVVWLLPFGIPVVLLVVWKRTGWKPPLWAPLGSRREREELRDLMSQPRSRDRDHDEA
jgi:hypothetical protein